MLSYKRSLPFFLVAETSFFACPPSFKVVGIAAASTIDEFFAFSSAFLKIEAWKISFTRTDYLWKQARLRVLTSLLACGKSFEVVGIAAASTIDEYFAFSGHFVKIIAWKISTTRTCLAW